MKKHLFLIFALVVGFSNINISQYYTTAQINTIHSAKTGKEGDMYKDTSVNLQYIGVTDGSLKLLSPHYVRVITKTADYTISLGESGAVITFNSAIDIVLTIPLALPIGYNLSVYQLGVGKVTISGSAGVTVLNRLAIYKTAGKDSGAGIVCTATNTYHVTGDLTK